MTPNRRPIDKGTLEAIVEIHGLTTVLEMLSEVCAEKAEHEQHEAPARRWRQTSVWLGQILTNLPRRGRRLRTTA
jgi:hypothetical protein